MLPQSIRTQQTVDSSIGRLLPMTEREIDGRLREAPEAVKERKMAKGHSR